MCIRDRPKHPTPDEVCLCVGNIAKQIIEYGVGRQVSKAEAVSYTHL